MQKRKKEQRKSQNNLIAQQQQQALQQQQSLQQQNSIRAHSPRQSMNTAQQLAMQQGQLIMNTQLHQHRLRGQYFSAYEQKPWYCDCAGTQIGCAGGTIAGDFQYRDLAYWKCELDSRGLSKCGVTYCNACVIRDERLGSGMPSTSPMAGGQQMLFNNHARASGSMGSGINQNFLQRNVSGATSNTSVGSNYSNQELASLQNTNDKNGKKNSKGNNAKIYNEPSIVKKGWMLKRGNIVKSWKRRYFVLKEDRQLFFYSNDQTSTVKGVAQFFEIEQIVKHDKQIFSVQLKGGRNWHFSCKDEADRDDWCLKLKLLCKAPIMIAKSKKDAKGGNKDTDEKE